MASRSLGTLTVDLILKMGGFKQGADAAAREAAAFEKKLTSSFSKASSTIRGFAAALGVGFSVDAIRRAAAEAIEYGDEIQKASVKTGIAVESFSELAYAAKQNDISLEGLGTAFKKMQVALSEANSGTKSANETLAALGLTFEDLKALQPDRQFELLADRIAALKDPADRVRASVDLFGKAGADLLPLFEQGAAGIRALREEAERTGATLTGEQAKALSEADDAIKRLDSSWSGFARTLTAKVAPAIADTADALQKLMARPPSGFFEWADFALSAAGGPVNFARYLEKRAGSQSVKPEGSWGQPKGGTSWGDASVVGSPTATPPGFRPPAKTGGGTLTAAQRAGLGEIAVTAREITVGAMEQLYRDMDAATQTAQEKSLASWQDFSAQLEELLNSGRISAEVFNARNQEMTDQFLEPITITAERIFPKKEREQLSEFWLEASRGAQQILADFLFDPFEDGLAGLAESFGRMLQRMAAEAVAAQIAEKVFGTGGVGSGGGWLGAIMSAVGSYGGGGSGLSEISITAQRIPGYAAGGFMRPGSFGIVGENGPELAFAGSRGATIQPMTGMTVVNHFNIQAPEGRVSRYTEQQIAAAAARGAARASARN